ncbi:MAG TPA: hypothetical protein VMW75_28940, partial [Thermoanaerobaculia bacterium]|nr:hypothetical protein [Thermoanaerobaculia bacterium]
MPELDPNPWNRGPVSRHPDPDDLALTASIARHGVQSNLLVRPAAAAGRFQVIFTAALPDPKNWAREAAATARASEPGSGLAAA